MEYPWIRIEDLSRFMLKELKQYHPDDPRHTPYWRELKLRCVEGVWGEDFGKFRYMPGRLFFYGHFCSILDVDEDEKVRRVIKPDIRDLEWERSYMYLEADGFSGWSNDELYTSEEKIRKIRVNYDPSRITSNPRWFKQDSSFKELIPAKENIRMLHDINKGKPLYYNNCKNIMELGSRGGGKMTSVNEPVLTTKGWVKMGDIEVGDYTYGRNGKPTQVIQIHPQGSKRVWRVKLQDGRQIDCGDDHLWTVRVGSGIEKVISTKEMYESGLTYKSKKGDVYKYRVPNCKPVEFEEKELPIDPYILGCLLGDGCMATATPKIASSDEFIINQFKERLPNFEIKHDSSTTNNYTLVDRDKAVIEVKNRWGSTHFAKVKNRLTLAIEELGLAKSCKFKFIPEIYKFSSVEQRMELLRGLIDTDGCVNKGGSIEFTNTNESLLDDVAELCRSLGIRCQKSIDKRAGQKHNIKGHDCIRSTYWRLYINTTLPIAKLPRKLERITKNHTLRQDFVSIIDIERTEEFVEQQCITVDNQDHTYITTDYIVTHNSYFYALAGAKYRITFDGIKVYNEANRKNPPKITIVIGSGRTDKSSEFANKIGDSMNRLAIDNSLGVWGKLGDEDYQPSPFFKDMTGSLRPNNKENPWRHEYEMNINGRWVKGFGSGSAIQHVSYSDNKREGAEAAAGGRYTDVITEEVGLTPKVIDAYNSNRATVTVGTNQFGVQVFLGTSGNMETIQNTRKMFTHPSDYEILSFPDYWEATGKTGFFLPAYMSAKQFKDKNGNTDIEAAKEYYAERRRKASQSEDPSILRVERMNYPIVPSDMWQTEKGNILPSQEAEEREKVLLKDNLYQKLGTPIKLFWSDENMRGIDYEIDHQAEPFYDWPIEGNRKSMSGSILIYDHPFERNATVEPDMYYFTHDPYVSDEIDKGGSLGTVHVWLSPKYWNTHMPSTGPLVASYIGKAPNGKKEFYQNVEKLVHYYGNPTRGFAYEANRGEYCRSFFKIQKKLLLLTLRPHHTNTQSIHAPVVTQYGFIIGNKIQKIEALDDLSDFLLQEIEIGGETKKLIHTLPCIFTLRQIRSFNLDGNFDSVSSLMLAPMYIKELEHKIIHEAKSKAGKRNPIGFLSANKRLMGYE